MKHNIVRMEPLLPTEYDLERAEGGHLTIQTPVEIHRENCKIYTALSGQAVIFLGMIGLCAWLYIKFIERK